MIRLTQITGALLIVASLLVYFAFNVKSGTVFIPAGLGLLMIIAAVVGTPPARRALGMHVAVGLAVLGFAGTVPGLLKLPTLLTDSESLERPLAVGLQSFTAALLLIYTVIAVRSFILARRAAPAD
jgi:hypothetical protein